MEPIDRLRELLDAHGLVTSTAESEITDGGHGGMSLVVLGLSGMILFDLEGDFMTDGRHARIVEEILDGSLVGGVSTSDRWIPKAGRLLEVRDGDRTGRFFEAKKLSPFGGDEPGETADDEWANPNLLIDALRFVAATRDLAVVAVSTFDQGMILGLLPKAFVEAIEASGISITTAKFDEQELNEDEDEDELDDEDEGEGGAEDEGDVDGPFADEAPALLVMDVHRATCGTEISADEVARLERAS